MQERNGAREVGLIVASLAVLVRFVDGAPFGVAAALVAVAAAAGTARVLGEWRPWRWPFDRLVIPVLAAFAAVGIAGLVDPLPWLAAVFIGSWMLVTWIVTLETAPFRPDDVQDGGVAAATPTATASVSIPAGRPAESAPAAGAEPKLAADSLADSEPAPVSRRRSRKTAAADQLVMSESAVEPAKTLAIGPGPEPAPAIVSAARVLRAPHPRPLAVRTAALGLAFLSFAAVGGFVPGGLAGSGRTLTGAAFATTIALDALIGCLIGVRIAALGTWTRRDLVIAAVTYAVIGGLGGALLRILALPRLFGPALLTLLVYVATGFRESPRPIRGNGRLLRETALLGLAGGAAVAWGLLAR